MAAEAKNPGSERSCQPPAAGKRRCCSARRPGELCQVYQLDQGGGVRPTRGEDYMSPSFLLMYCAVFKSPDGKYFRYCWPYSLCCEYSALPLKCETTHGQMRVAMFR